MTTLSKSKYLSGLQCSKLLWFIYNLPEEMPEVDAATQAIFDQGHLVGEYAEKLFPDGVEIDHSAGFDKGFKETKSALAKRVPIFEAAFSSNNCYFRADILEPVGRDEWNIIEVKSSTEVQDINYFDVGFQLYTSLAAGLKVDKCYLMHIDNSYVRKGTVDPRKLFKKIDITSKVKNEFMKNVDKNVDKMIGVIQSKKCPDILIGEQCRAPYNCVLADKCHAFLPERNVLELYRNKKLGYRLIKDGIYKLADVPKHHKLNAKQLIQIDSAKSNAPYIDSLAIKSFLKKIKYPAYYMDFETWTSAVPLFDDMRPYQQIPFQFSVHVVEEYGASPTHYSFLADGNADPRLEFMTKLEKMLGTEGSVIAYNASFEKTCLKECAEAYPKFKLWVESINSRIVDLLKPFQSFAYYHPKQAGSCSVKKVLPVLTDMSYSNMEIGEGGTASREYFRVTFTDKNSDKAKVRKLLEDYCALDTLGMVAIVDLLSNKLKG